MDYTDNLKDVIAKEEEYLRQHRAINGTDHEDDDASELTNKWGLCISGGGIRSATLGLGMLQKFMRDGVYKYFDYMCTVSGGGYIGSCVSSLLSSPVSKDVKNAKTITTDGKDIQLGVERDDAPFLSRGKYIKDQNHYTPKHQLHHLLTHGEYLTRNRSIFSLDIKRLVSAVLGGAISNIVLLLLMSLLLVSGILFFFQLIGGDIVLTYSFDSVFEDDGSVNWGFLTRLPNGQNFWHWARVCFGTGIGFTALFYWESRFYVLQNLVPTTLSGFAKGERFRYGRMAVFFKKINQKDLLSTEKRSTIAQKFAELLEFSLEKGYELTRNLIVRFFKIITFQKKQAPRFKKQRIVTINKEDFLVQRRISRFAIWTILLTTILVSAIIYYQREAYNDDSIRLILTLPIFFTAGSLLFMFLLGLIPQARGKHERIIRSIYTGMYGGAFNGIIAALLIPFAIVGIFFFDWDGYGINSPVSLIAPATAYLLTVKSDFFKLDAFKGLFETVLPRLQRIILNLSVVVFLFLIFQILAKFIMNPNNAIHYELRDGLFGGLGSGFLFWYGLGCSIFAFLFMKVEVTANPFRVAFINFFVRIIKNPLHIFVGFVSNISTFITDVFEQLRNGQFIVVYFSLSIGLSVWLVWINTHLDNFMMDFLPLFVVLCMSFTAILVGYFFTRKQWKLYNSIVLLVVLSILLPISVDIWQGNTDAVKTVLQQNVNLNLTPATYFIGSVLLTLILGFFFIKRYRGTVFKFYQDRLTESFLMTDGVTINPSKEDIATFGVPQRRLRNHEKLTLDELGDNNYRAPYHILLASLNLRSKYTYLRKDLKSQHFIFSKYFLGSKMTGYVNSQTYRDDGHKMTLSSAMTISAAAVNSAMGVFGFFAQTFFVTLFNLRLGKWIKNPLTYAPNSTLADDGNRRVNGISNLLREYSGFFTTDTRSVNVSDGGHTGDNLGLLPLLRRRCSTIVVCDFEEDRNFTFSTLNTVLRMAYVEEGIWIHIDLSDLMPKTGKGVETNKSVAVGTIYYPNEKRGKIVYIKSSLSGNLATNIWGYHRRFSDFPHQSTADQYFDGAQYEAYRSLGYDLAEMSIDILELRRKVEKGQIIEPQDYEVFLGEQKTKEQDIMMDGVKQLSYQELEQWQEAQKPFELVDVREVTEHKAFNIGGKHIPLAEIIRRHHELDFTKPVVVYCKRGIRSNIAIQRLQQKIKHNNFYNLNQGILHLIKQYKEEE